VARRVDGHEQAVIVKEDDKDAPTSQACSTRQYASSEEQRETLRNSVAHARHARFKRA